MRKMGWGEREDSSTELLGPQCGLTLKILMWKSCPSEGGLGEGPLGSNEVTGDELLWMGLVAYEDPRESPPLLLLCVDIVGRLHLLWTRVALHLILDLPTPWSQTLPSRTVRNVSATCKLQSSCCLYVPKQIRCASWFTLCRTESSVEGHR
jgi:hypothetical protein